MKKAIPSRDLLPRGWDLAKWDTAKAEMRAVIWDRGLAHQPISYEELGGMLKLTRVPVSHRSNKMTGLLDEIDRDERLLGADCWVTAFVVKSGEEYSSIGLFRLVPEHLWRRRKAAFCAEQRELAHDWIKKHPVK